MLYKLILILVLGFILHSCCSIDFPKYDENIKKQQMNLISKILNNHEYIEKITLDTALSTEFFYHSINDTGLKAYISRMKYFDCETKFISFETKAVKTHDNSFKIGNLYYFNNKEKIAGKDLVFIFLNLNKKWYLDDIVVQESKPLDNESIKIE